MLYNGQYDACRYLIVLGQTMRTALSRAANDILMSSFSLSSLALLHCAAGDAKTIFIDGSK